MKNIRQCFGDSGKKLVRLSRKKRLRGRDIHTLRVAARTLKALAPLFCDGVYRQTAGVAVKIAADFARVRELKLFWKYIRDVAAENGLQQELPEPVYSGRVAGVRQKQRQKFAALFAVCEKQLPKAELRKKITVDDIVGKLATAINSYLVAPDPRQLHAIRLRAKKCRYRLESCFPEQQLKINKISSVQDLIGEYHDRQVFKKYLQRLPENSGLKTAVSEKLEQDATELLAQIELCLQQNNL